MAAVMLTTVTSPLPDITYTVAIEWAYYAFILLVAICVFSNLVEARLAAAERERAAHAVSVGTRVFYPVFVAAVVLAYLLAYG